MKTEKHEQDKTPLDKQCTCYVCKHYSKAYIRHQLLQEEGAGYQLASYHNLYYLQQLMRKTHEAIINKTFKQFHKKIKRDYQEL